MNELEQRLLLSVEDAAREMMKFSGWEDECDDEPKATVMALRDVLNDLEDYRRILARTR